LLARFIEIGAQLVATDPQERYGKYIGTNRRALEPGFIPLIKPPRLTIVSYYPNASTLAVAEYTELDQRFRRWGETGSREDYEVAYHDWVATMPLWPFFRKWVEQILTEIGVQRTEIAWLPLVKLPCPPENPPNQAMMVLDRDCLRAQLELLRPSVIWVQSKEVYESAGGLLQEIQRAIVVQKLYKTKTSRTSPETPRIIRDLRRYLG